MVAFVGREKSCLMHRGIVVLAQPPLSITFPLIMLAIPSAIIGYLTIEPMLFKGWLDEAITVTSSHVSMVELKHVLV
jgi:NADH-quinone oxidoreductase subunit L